MVVLAFADKPRELNGECKASTVLILLLKLGRPDLVATGDEKELAHQ